MIDAKTYVTTTYVTTSYGATMAGDDELASFVRLPFFKQRKEAFRFLLLHMARYDV